MNVVLVTPCIPQNTGNIGRLCAGTDTTLHLVEPLGFSLDSKYVRRAGLDYWPNIKLRVHPNFEALRELAGPDANMAFYSGRGTACYTSFQPSADAWLVYGAETTGLPEEIMAAEAHRTFHIPITDKVRSLNLSNSVALTLYDAFARMDFPFKQGVAPRTP